MLSRVLIGLIAGGAVAMAAPGMAGADPTPPPGPVLPNVNAYTPVSPVEYSVMNGLWYAFPGPDGVVCGLNRVTGGYGCYGALPGAPGGANLVSGGPSGPPGFANADRSIFSGVDMVKILPPNTRLSYRDVSCGVDGGGAVACVNQREQVGFVVGPAGTFIADVNPLVERPEGTPMVPTFPG